MDTFQLEKIGLKKKEAGVYVALLKRGESLANQLAKETKILRTSIYDYLDVLLDRGFASYVVKSGKKYFQAVDPRKILDKFEEQKERERLALREIVPKLSDLQNMGKRNVGVEVFEGKEGIKTVLFRVLRDNPKEALVYGSSGVAHKLLPFFMEHFHKQRVKQKIKFKIMYNKVPEAKERVKEGPSLKHSEVKFLPIEETSLTGNLIYDNNVMIFILNPEVPLVICIESAEITKSYRNNFEILWKVAKK